MCLHGRLSTGLLLLLLVASCCNWQVARSYREELSVHSSASVGSHSWTGPFDLTSAEASVCLQPGSSHECPCNDRDVEEACGILGYMAEGQVSFTTGTTWKDRLASSLYTTPEHVEAFLSEIKVFSQDDVNMDKPFPCKTLCLATVLAGRKLLSTSMPQFSGQACINPACTEQMPVSNEVFRNSKQPSQAQLDQEGARCLAKLSKHFNQGTVPKEFEMPEELIEYSTKDLIRTVAGMFNVFIAPDIHFWNGASEQQQLHVATVAQEAIVWILAALRHMQEAETQLKQLFGRSDPATQVHVHRMLFRMMFAANNLYVSKAPHDSCAEGTSAYVATASWPGLGTQQVGRKVHKEGVRFEVNLCDSWWQFEMPKAGMYRGSIAKLVAHHFGAVDVEQQGFLAYGPQLVVQLARENPDEARQNADSYARFVFALAHKREVSTTASNKLQERVCEQVDMVYGRQAVSVKEMCERLKLAKTPLTGSDANACAQDKALGSMAGKADLIHQFSAVCFKFCQDVKSKMLPEQDCNQISIDAHYTWDEEVGLKMPQLDSQEMELDLSKTGSIDGQHEKTYRIVESNAQEHTQDLVHNMESKEPVQIEEPKKTITLMNTPCYHSKDEWADQLDDVFDALKKNGNKCDLYMNSNIINKGFDDDESCLLQCQFVSENIPTLKTRQAIKDKAKKVRTYSGPSSKASGKQVQQVQPAVNQQTLRNDVSRQTIGDAVKSMQKPSVSQRPDLIIKNAAEVSKQEEKLEKLIGLKSVKEQMMALKAQMLFNLRRKSIGLGTADSASLHMAFMGNPGTGKTVVARIVAELMIALDVLQTPPKGAVVKEVTRADLIAEASGQTAPKVKKAVQDAFGGVLFIDEAYSLCKNHKDEFGKEAVDTLIKEMEDNGQNVIVILAGYHTEMDKFLNANPGFKSRIAFNFDFHDYSCEELVQIGERTLEDRHMYMTPQPESLAKDSGFLCSSQPQPPQCKWLQAVATLHTGCSRNDEGGHETIQNDRTNGNGRTVRNILESSFRAMSQRVLNTYKLTMLNNFKIQGHNPVDLKPNKGDVPSVSLSCGEGSTFLNIRGKGPFEDVSVIGEADLRCAFRLLEWEDLRTTLIRTVHDKLVENCIDQRMDMKDVDVKATLMSMEAPPPQMDWKKLHRLLWNEKRCAEAKTLFLVGAGKTSLLAAGSLLERQNSTGFGSFDCSRECRFYTDCSLDTRCCKRGCDVCKSKGGRFLCKDTFDLDVPGNDEQSNDRSMANDAYRREAIIDQKRKVVGPVKVVREGSAVKELMDELDKMVGLSSVKEGMATLRDTVEFDSWRKLFFGDDSSLLSQSFHMQFLGNPGTGKTVIARKVGKLLTTMGVIKGDKCDKDRPQGDIFKEVTRADLVGKYLGETAGLVHKAVDAACGGVLFIDEAYALVQGNDDQYGHEAVDELIKLMEEKRTELIVILAGYQKEMQTFLESNPGFISRVPFRFDFLDYSCEDLGKIAVHNAEQKDMTLVEPAKLLTTELLTTITGCCTEAIIAAGKCAGATRDNGNGRSVRNTVESAIRAMSVRSVVLAGDTKVQDSSGQDPCVVKQEERQPFAQKLCPLAMEIEKSDIALVAADLLAKTLRKTCKAQDQKFPNTEKFPQSVMGLEIPGGFIEAMERSRQDCITATSYIEQSELTGDFYDAKKVMVKETGLAEAFAKLDRRIGLKSVKDSMRMLYCNIKFRQLRTSLQLKDTSEQSYHMRFLGNPGTGKTVVARDVGAILSQMNVVVPRTDDDWEPAKKKFSEVARSELVGEYSGHTAKQVKQAVMNANGGVMFIDEAYSLVQSKHDKFGHEAVDSLIKEMEDNRGHVIIILAGYEAEMETFFDSNPGFKSRVPFTFNFEDYTCGELGQIASQMLEDRKITMPQDNRTAKAAMSFTTRCCNQLEGCPVLRSRSNGRAVRNAVEAAVRNMATRLMVLEKETKEPQPDEAYTILDPEDWRKVTALQVEGRLRHPCSAQGELKRIGDLMVQRTVKLFSDDSFEGPQELEEQLFVVRQVAEDVANVQALDAIMDERSRLYRQLCTSKLNDLAKKTQFTLNMICMDTEAYQQQYGEKGGVLDLLKDELANVDDPKMVRTTAQQMKTVMQNAGFLTQLLEAIYSSSSPPPPELPQLDQLCKRKLASIKETRFNSIPYDLLTA